MRSAAQEELLNTYVSLIGEVVDIGALRADLSKVPSALEEAYLAESARVPPDPYRYAEAARRLMGLSSFLISAAEASAILRSPAGTIYRDLFYRLLLQQLEAESTERGASFRASFIASLRHNPVRLLLDRFLDGWPTQVQFAEAAALSRSSISRTFKYLFLSEGEPSMTLDRLVQAFARLGILPSDVGMAQPAAEQSPSLFQSQARDVTLRDRHLRIHVALAARIWFVKEIADDTVRKWVCLCVLYYGFHLIYGALEESDLRRLAEAAFLELSGDPVVTFVAVDQAPPALLGRRIGAVPLIAFPIELREELQPFVADAASNPGLASSVAEYVYRYDDKGSSRRIYASRPPLQQEAPEKENLIQFERSDVTSRKKSPEVRQLKGIATPSFDSDPPDGRIRMNHLPNIIGGHFFVARSNQ
jgi:hypothetical protein